MKSRFTRMKKVLSRIICLFLTLLIIFAFNGCFSASEDISTDFTVSSSVKSAASNDEIVSQPIFDPQTSEESQSVNAQFTVSSEAITSTLTEGTSHTAPASSTSSNSVSSESKSSTVTTSRAQSKVSSEDDTPTVGSIVYRTPYGKRYHLDPDCGGKNSYTVTIDEATGAGLTPCKKCAQ